MLDDFRGARGWTATEMLHSFLVRLVKSYME